MSEREFFYGAKKHLFVKAKELRINMTYAETLLWEKLRNKQINGVKIRRQHPINRFIADFYCHRARLVIEVDGEIHNYQKEYDIGRSEEMGNFNIKVIRFSNKEVIENLENVITKISAEIDQRLQQL